MCVLRSIAVSDPYSMYINRKITKVIVCSKDPENINNKMDDDAKASTKIRVTG